jgi:hypothetical protein
MGMEAVLCTLSPKRLALIEDDPGVLEELLAARHDEDTPIPGLLDLGKTWHALDVLLGDGRDPVLGDAIVARTGVKLKARSGFGQARLLAPPRVVDVAKQLAALPAAFVAERYPSLYGKQVHGDWGQEIVGAGDNKWLRDKVTARRALELSTLTEAMASLTALYAQAAASRHSVISVIT